MEARNYIEETRGMAERSIECSKRSIAESRQAAEHLGWLSWLENLSHVHYAPKRDSCGVYLAWNEKDNVRAVDPEGKPYPAMSYISAWEVCKALNGKDA